MPRSMPDIDYGDLTIDPPRLGTSYKTGILPILQRLFDRFARVPPVYLFSFSSTDPANSVFHMPREHMTVGDIIPAAYSDSNMIPGSGGAWEVLSLEDAAQTPSQSGSISNNLSVWQATWAKLAFRPPSNELTLQQLFVNTMGGTSMQGRIHHARDLAMRAIPRRRSLRATGEVTVGTGASDGYDMLTANFDFRDLRINENPLGSAGYLLRVGDPDTGGVLGLGDFAHSRAFVQGLNQSPNATSGPNGGVGYDFQGAPGQQTPGQGSVGATIKPSTAIGVLMANCDSVEDREFNVSRCLVGIKVEGNTEKQNVKARVAVCGIGLQDYTTKGTPDTNRWEVSFNLCKQAFVSGDDSTGHLVMNCEARIDDGSSFPAAYNPNIMIPTPCILNSNGKRWKYSFEERAMNGRLGMYIDRLTSSSILQQGSDTVQLVDCSSVHTFGTRLCADRVQYIDGNYHAKDSGPGRLNKADDDDATCAQLPGGCFEINNVQKSMSALHLVAEDCYNEYGFIFGDVVKGLKSTDKRIGSITAAMRKTTGYSGKTYANRDMKFIKGALCVRSATRVYIPMLECNHNVVLEAGCEDCTIELPSTFLEETHVEINASTGAVENKPNVVIKHPSATANIIIKGSVTAAKLASITWAWAGVRAESVSDRGGRPAIYNGTNWVLPTYGEQL